MEVLVPGRARTLVRRFKAMGSPCAVYLYADRSVATRAAQAAIADVRRIERKYSRYRDDSVTSAINRAGAEGGVVEIDSETFALLNYAQVCYEQSDGLFDITSGVLRQLWNFDSAGLPEKGDILELKRRIGWPYVDWDKNQLRFARRGMELDFGGLGKEYAVDRAATICRELGVDSGLVDLGGDIKIIGPHPDGRAWRVGVQHPRLADELLAVVELHSGAVASSGDYERYVEIEGQRYNHILSPETGWPVLGMRGVSVVAEQCVVAGSATTISILKEGAGPEWLEGLGLPHVWMDREGQVGGSLPPLRGEAGRPEGAGIDTAQPQSHLR